MAKISGFFSRAVLVFQLTGIKDTVGGQDSVVTDRQVLGMIGLSFQ